ncbi:unnamed protein product [Chondrus crispus]|uniref:Uncharacterized protein n=1 Tax=Chondrus crispus TaxID=2769 RepID=R7QPV2_CHOCR|nr:unnamed protein product [Chondrus crispus]CDF40502.1 unnamed protein product [Chondrus crispus]|eukprot:XP_005710796.1 unnamed protein product [Chondrus crispus]
MTRESAHSVSSRRPAARAVRIPFSVKIRSAESWSPARSDLTASSKTGIRALDTADHPLLSKSRVSGTRDAAHGLPGFFVTSRLSKTHAEITYRCYHPTSRHTKR